MKLVHSQALFRRAAEVIPGGIYGHTSPSLTVPGAMPAFAAESVGGCRYRDVDGNEFIDLMCGYGPLILGNCHPEVDTAAAAARERGACFNHPTPLLVELAEKFVERIDFADWAVFGKNGSDLTSWAIMVAREATGRPGIVKMRGAYHGAHAWCTPGHGGVIPEDRARIHECDWGDSTGLEKVFHQRRGTLAALILTPIHHPAYGDTLLPEPEFVASVNRLCREHGVLLILDDVRTAFRLSTGGSHSVFGYEPDLAVYCKALANGHPISACAGRAAIKVAASRVYLTGSYWNDPAPMAAALATLDIIARENLPEKLARAGRRLVDGMVELGARHGVELLSSGPAALPYVRVKDDPSLMRTQRLCAAAAAHGVFLHPHHNWFMGAAHTDSEIDEALARLHRAFVTSAI